MDKQLMGRWVSGEWSVGRWSVGRWSVVLIKPFHKTGFHSVQSQFL